MKKIKFNTKGEVVNFKKFSEEENKVWKILCERQLKNLEGKVSKIREDAWKILALDINKIPDFVELNNKLRDLSGWEILMTNIEYEESNPWVEALHDKKFRITDYIRSKTNLNYTPLPDIFHDVFGHIPFFANPKYARIVHKFGLAMKRAKSEEEKNKITNNWWYGFEFSLIKENNEIKALGTGLMSSAEELDNALSDKVEKIPYDGDIVGDTEKSPHEMHKKLFVLESLDQLEAVVDRWLK